MTTTPDDEDREHPLRVVYRRVQHEEVGAVQTLGVFCARQARAIDLRECRHCEHSQGLRINPTDGDTFLRCGGGDAAVAEALDATTEQNPDAPARATQLRDIMVTPAHWVSPEPSVSDLTAVFSLPGEASISSAAALMAYGGVHRIVVTGRDSIAVGILSSLDILRWLARRDGYVLPDVTRLQSNRNDGGAS